MGRPVQHTMCHFVNCHNLNASLVLARIQTSNQYMHLVTTAVSRISYNVVDPPMCDPCNRLNLSSTIRSSLDSVYLDGSGPITVADGFV